MLYSLIVETYKELEKTAKRLEKTYLIAKLLKKTATDDLEIVTLLVQGNIFPTYDQREIGVAARLILKAISQTSGIEQKIIENKWASIGDLGKVAEEVVAKKKQSTLYKEELTIKKVITNLRKLAELTGAGTVEKKLQLIRELLSSATPAEAKYIVRTILGDMRIGAAEGSIRDAIVWAFFPPIAGVFFQCSKCKTWMPKTAKCLECGNKIDLKQKKYTGKILKIKSIKDIENKNLKKYDLILAEDEKTAREAYNYLTGVVQRAINLSNDLGITALTAKTKGVKGLLTIKLKTGVPIKVMLFQKAKDLEDAFSIVGKPAQIEQKYDGFRCITGNTPIYVKEKGLLSIKNIKKEDYVLTHSGKFKKVIAMNKRKIDKKERLFKIQSYLGNSFRISEGHKIYIWKNNKPQWMEIEKVNKNDKLIFPLPRINEKKVLGKELKLKNKEGYSKIVKVNKDFFRFLGYWIGDGYTNNYHNTERVGLIFNLKKGRKLCNYYKKIIYDLFNIEKISESIHNNAIYLYWRDKPLRKWLSKYFRREWKGKKIPEWFLGIKREYFEEFLKGWIESDGYTDKIGRTSITTKERDMAMNGQLMGLIHKKIIAIKKLMIKGSNYYKLIITKTDRGLQIKNQFILINILRLEEIKRPDPRINLYNLQVEDNESYCSTMISLHNCQIHKNKEIKLFTRRLEDVSKQFPDIVEVVKNNIKADNYILDGEVIGIDPKTKKWLPFQNISQRIKRKYDIKETIKEIPVMLNVFDAVMINNKNLIKEPFKKRRKLLEKVVKPVPNKLAAAKSLITDSEQKAEAFYKESLEKGNEGVMVKNLNAVYEPGSRVGYGVKVKPTMETLDLVIIGADWGQGKRANWLSSFTIACRKGDKFVEIGKVGTGIKEKGEGVSFRQLTELLKPLIVEQEARAVVIKPKIIIEVDYEEIQKSPTYTSGFALRFPRVIKLREDKPADEADSLDKVKRLYEQQRGRK